MLKRRNFLKAAGAATAAALVSRHPLLAEIVAGEEGALHFVSDSMELQLSASAPEFLSLNVDGLGKGKRGANIIGANKSDAGYKASASISGGVHRVAYRSNLAAENSPAAWTLQFSSNRIVLTSEWSADCEPPAMVFPFDLNQVHSTVLGRVPEKQSAGGTGAHALSGSRLGAAYRECPRCRIDLYVRSTKFQGKALAPGRELRASTHRLYTRCDCNLSRRAGNRGRPALRCVSPQLAERFATQSVAPGPRQQHGQR